MAHVERFGTYVILSLSRTEKIFAFHGNIQVKFSELISVKPVKKVWTMKVLRGFRAPGTGLPFVVGLGTLRLRRGKNFMAVYGRKPGYVFTFSKGSFNQWIITPDNTPEEMAELFDGVFQPIVT
ncbi:MAG: hypothetical protein F2704_03590 [Actinobacteria bacterium]|uniref:Unannotated protein n=1 Tax=freshwater metagenome TaxID=449393 RepID=A0A6J7U7Z3_9ZZZZ|nr:hypothetical protein [Actinomycetota bacterium]MSW47799.1 hypothetical protein [Actinomycetota bacterium]MSX24971.1 hypothetical protein [Actinomycetota bacterium]MSY46413.1 hypothetical protein [Actinomycetota bacterium]MSY57339.1 hypothetical protein [Actinomycetota bacterium]